MDPHKTGCKSELNWSEFMIIDVIKLLLYQLCKPSLDDGVLNVVLLFFIILYIHFTKFEIHYLIKLS